MPTTKLDPEKRYNLTLQHGPTAKVIRNAEVRSFKQDGSIRWEATGMHQNSYPDANRPQDEWETYEEEQTVGFDPKNVVKAEEV